MCRDLVCKLLTSVTNIPYSLRGRHGSGRIVARFIFTNAIGVYNFKVVSSNPAHARCAQHYVIKFVSN